MTPRVRTHVVAEVNDMCWCLLLGRGTATCRVERISRIHTPTIHITPALPMDTAAEATASARRRRRRQRVGHGRGTAGGRYALRFGRTRHGRARRQRRRGREGLGRPGEGERRGVRTALSMAVLRFASLLASSVAALFLAFFPWPFVTPTSATGAILGLFLQIVGQRRIPIHVRILGVSIHISACCWLW